MDEHKQIGALFREKGLITAAALEDALAEQRRNGGRLGEILVAQGAITRLDLASAIGKQWGKVPVSRELPAQGGEEQGVTQIREPADAGTPDDGGTVVLAAVANGNSGPDEAAEVSASEAVEQTLPTAEPAHETPGGTPAFDAENALRAPISLPDPVTSEGEPLSEQPTALLDEALQIIRRRYALGELTRGQYLELAADLAL